VDAVQHAIATYHEVALKGGNRGWFERTLLRNVRSALAGLPVAEVSLPARVVITFSEPVPWPVVHARLVTVFGLNALIPVTRVGASYEELESHVASIAPDIRGASFAVRCKRSDKRFPLTSQDVERRLGALVSATTGLRVDLTAPDLTLHELLQSDGIYLYRHKFPGPGGLPVGTSGRVLVLLSGGIDSPVAAYLALKRGTRAHFVHFHSAPYTPDASVRKTEEIVATLNRHQGSSRLAVVPFGECQREVVARCDERLRVILYRRLMLRVAERIARRWRCLALVTGESLNQVASQTLENMAAIDRVAHLPVLRPLVGSDKQEIVDLAVRAGTYEISILPHHDCCSFLQPSHPATRTTPAACDQAEAALDVESWARRLQHEATTLHIGASGWGATPAVTAMELGS
jgi:thiamine biosynthesis protein ThiI